MDIPGYIKEAKDNGKFVGYECSNEDCDDLIREGDDAVMAELVEVDYKELNVVNHAGVYHRDCFEDD